MALSPELLGGARVLAGLLSLGFLSVAVRNRDRPGSLGFGLFVVGTAFWSVAAAVDISTSDYGLSRLVYNLLFLGAELAAVGWLLLALDVTDRLDVGRRVLAGLAGWLVLMQALMWTNPAHWLILGPGTTVEQVVLAPEYSVGFWVHVAVSYLFIAVGTGVLVVESVRSDGLRRRQTLLLALAAVPSVAANLVSLFDVAFAPFDVAPFGFLLTAVVFAVVLFRGRFLDVAFVARRTALEETTDAVVVLDDRQRVVDCNEAARELFDGPASRTGMQASAFFDALPDDARDRLLEDDDAETEATLRVGDEYRHVLMSSSPIGEATRRGRVVICHDITLRRRREQTLEHQNEQLEQFASVVSHDLRNPLSVAMGRLEIAREEHDSEHLEAVAGAHDRMQELISDMLTLAREGAAVSETSPVDLALLVGESWDGVETSAATLVAETERVVRADRSRLQQLLANLLRNAVEHGGADVTVTVGDLEDGFFVADDGPGIPADERATAFQSGYSTAGTGAGLGLTIVQQIAGAHDWAVRVVESDAGGARFEITGVELVE